MDAAELPAVVRPRCRHRCRQSRPSWTLILMRGMPAARPSAIRAPVWRADRRCSAWARSGRVAAGLDPCEESSSPPLSVTTQRSPSCRSARRRSATEQWSSTKTQIIQAAVLSSRYVQKTLLDSSVEDLVLDASLREIKGLPCAHLSDTRHWPGVRRGLPVCSGTRLATGGRV